MWEVWTQKHWQVHHHQWHSDQDTQLIPEMQRTFFQRQVCTHTALVEMTVTESQPMCECCHTIHSMVLTHSHFMFYDKQMIKPKEFPKNICREDTSHCHPSCLQWSCWKGSTQRQSEHFRHLLSYSYWLKPRVNNVNLVYKTHTDVIHYQRMDAKCLHEEADQKLFSEKHVELFKELSRKPDVYDYLLQPQLQACKEMKI